MAHQAIYRKWRPVTFDDIVGQEHITRTLKNQIMQGTVGHAYLFCGTRGTGKTTCAKVLSRAVNCLNPKDGNPCNECDVCRGIIDGSIMDVTEMDAASNNGVDNIRDIREDINYVARNSKYTVYIIDEVHMLSTGAFNALLKTLEEPPQNVIFILATTESHKVPQTILSRCQRFDFKRIRNEDIIVRMKEIACADGYKITDDAYQMLASLAEGSMRDGLSIMERVISATGTEITGEDITNTLGISGTDTVFRLTDAIISGDAGKVISIIDRVVADGKELPQLATSMLSHLRSLMLCKLSDNPETVLDTDAQTLQKYKSQSNNITFDKINHGTTLISNAIADARVAKSSRIVYELAFIKLARPDIDSTPEGVLDRISNLELKMEMGGTMPVMGGVSVDTTDLEERIKRVEDALKNGVRAEVNVEETKAPEPEIKTSARLYVPIPEDELNADYPTAVLARNWERILLQMKNRNGARAIPLMKAGVSFDKEGLILLFKRDNDFALRSTTDHIDEVRDLFRTVAGKQYNLKVAIDEEFDPNLKLNPFTLPKAGESVDETAPEIATEDTATSLEGFFDKYSEIITDGDRVDILNTDDVKGGEQSSLDDEDDREEFLEESELPVDDEEEV